MRDPHVHDEQRSFMCGLMTGALLGAGLAMLFAPRRGSELRSQLSDAATTLANSASRTYRQATDTATEWAERGREVGGQAVRKARQAVKKGAEQAERYVKDASEHGPYAVADDLTESAMFDDRDERREH